MGLSLFWMRKSIAKMAEISRFFLSQIEQNWKSDKIQ